MYFVGIFTFRLPCNDYLDWKPSPTCYPVTVLNIWRIYNYIQLLKNLQQCSLQIFIFIDSGNPLMSRHSYLVYWLFLQHCRSKDTTLSFSFKLTFLVIARSPSNFLKSFLKFSMSLSILAKVEVTYFGTPVTDSQVHP